MQNATAMQIPSYLYQKFTRIASRFKKRQTSLQDYTRKAD